MRNAGKWLLLLSRIIIGIVFIYSGFVKGVDPLGSTYKFTDYFNAFNTPWANNLSFILSILQSVAEFVIGAAVLLNLKIRSSSLGALIFMLIFTPLTLYIAIANPVHDCGCFGDALVVTNWQTFWKNLILLIPTLFLFKNRARSINILNKTEQWFGVSILIIFIGIVINFSYKHLPIIDFRPYKIGTHIPSSMIVPEGAPADVWESIFIYKKNDIEKEFNVSELPDSTWTFVDAQHKLIKKGYQAPIHDFSIVSIEGTEITDIVLNSKNYNFLFVAYNLEKTEIDNMQKISALASYCYEQDYPFYGLTASSTEASNEFLTDNDAIFEFYNTDEITLKTIIRSNPGIVIIKDGVVIDKWHINDIPDTNEINTSIIADSISKCQKRNNTYLMYIFILLGGFICSIYLLLRKKK